MLPFTIVALPLLSTAFAPLTVPLSSSQPFTPIRAIHDHPQVSRVALPHSPITATQPRSRSPLFCLAFACVCCCACWQSEGKYRIRCRLVALLPPSVSLFSHVFCARCGLASPTAEAAEADEEGKAEVEGGSGCGLSDFCAQCGGRDALSYRWGFLLLLEDSTGLIAAGVWGSEAALLLPGLSPCNLHLSHFTRRAVEQRLQRLQAEGAWLDCWLSSFPSSPLPAPHQQVAGAAAAAAALSASAWAASPGFNATQDSVGLLSLDDDDSGDDGGGSAGRTEGRRGVAAAPSTAPTSLTTPHRHYRLILTVPNTTPT